MPQSHQLAAIMFTDIVGYTALMGEDEDKGYRLLKQNRNIQKPLIEKYGGIWLKEMGDGTLASFSSISEAVYCAKEIQEACLDEPELNLRIGIHLGEVIIEDGDVFGDGVNIASRIEALAPAGGICISESVFQNIQNMKRIETEYIQEVKLKNVKRPVRIYQVSINGETKKAHEPKLASHRTSIITISAVVVLLMIIAVAWHFYRLNQSAISQEELIGNSDDLSIAVLPFVNMSSDPDQEYFSDGITEEIITHLANIGALSVISRTSVFQYKNNLKKLPIIAEELDVTYILEGSVRKENDRLRITTQLIDAKADKHLWAQNYDRKLEEVLDIQTEVAKKIAASLDIQLTNPEINRLERKSTEMFSAYDYYLKAIHADKNWTYEGSLEAIGYLEKATDLDPNFSKAYSLYAWQFVHQATTTSKIHPAKALEKALPAIKKAVELDPLSSDAYLVYGSINFYLEWNFDEAKMNFEKSMELNSWGEAPIYQCLCAYVEFLLINDKFEETKHLFETINRIDPAFFLAFEYESLLLLNNNEKNLALKTFKKQLEYSDPENWYTYTSYGEILYLTGNYDEAIIQLNKGLSFSNDRGKYLISLLALAHFQSGDREVAMNILEELLLRKKSGEYGVNAFIALLYNEFGDEEKTFEYLEQAYEAHEFFLLWLKIIHFQNLREHPKYLGLLRKIGFEV